jgi:hypothetical protein
MGGSMIYVIITSAGHHVVCTVLFKRTTPQCYYLGAFSPETDKNKKKHNLKEELAREKKFATFDFSYL